MFTHRSRLATTALLLFAACTTTIRAQVYIADAQTNVLYKFSTPGGLPPVFVSDVHNPVGLTLDPAGNLYEADYDFSTGVGTIYKYTSTGAASAFATGFVHLLGLTFDGAGNLFAAGVDASQTVGTIYKVTPDGTVSTFATGTTRLRGLTFDAAGNLYAADLDAGNVYKYSPAGTRTTFATGLNDPTGLAFDGKGNLFVCSQGVGIFEVTPAGAVSTFTTNVTDPRWLAFDASGSLYVSDVGNASGDPGQGMVYLFTATGARTTVASGLEYPTGLAVAGVIAAATPIATVAATTDTTQLGGQPGVFTVSLGAAAVADVKVAYELKGTAVNGSDYTLLKGTVKIKAGKTDKAILVVPQAPHGIPNAKKTVKLTLEPGTGYTVGAAATAKVKIIPGSVIILR